MVIFHKKRNEQSIFWMHETIEEQMKRAFYGHPEISKKLKEFETLVMNNEISSFVAAGKLLNIYSGLKKQDIT